ncbi:MAG TPA: hypothetical protein VGM44_22285 [Polyangiaceae bacterium]
MIRAGVVDQTARHFTLLFAAALVAGCVGPNAESSSVTSPDSVSTRPDSAVVQGAVGSIDGNPASSGSELFIGPGCHVVATASHYTDASDNGLSVRGTLPTAYFALNMSEGKNYFVEVTVLDPTAASSRLSILAYERDSSGTVQSTYRALRREEDARELCARGGEPPAPKN